MSTRVQKGGPIFRPVAKPRGRSTISTSRQSSAAPDSQGTGAPSGNIDVLTPASMATMLPPAAIPSTVRSVSHGPQPIRPTQPTSFSVPPPANGNTQLARLPTPSNSQPNPNSAIAISTPTRNTPLPPTPSQSSSFPVAVTRSSATPTPQIIDSVPPQASMDHSQLHPSNLTFNQILMGPPPIQYHGFNTFEQQLAPNQGSDVVSVPSGLSEESGDLPRLTINADSAVKVPQPRRKSGRKKKVAVETGEPEIEDGEDTAQHKARRGTRSRKPQNAEEVSANDGELQSTDPVTNGVHIESTEPIIGSRGTKRGRRSSSISHKPRRSRGPSQPSFDLDADPGEELDPTVVTMSTLCSDTGQGRISSKAVQIQTNHAAWKASNREKRARMKILMESKKYGKNGGADEAVTGRQSDDAPPAENTASGNAAAGPSNQSGGGSVRAPSTGPPPEDETGQGFDYSQSMSTSRFNVQVRIGPNGETIIDEESLFVDRVDENETVHYTHVEESDTTKFVNSSTYGKKFRGSRWSAEETELFFDALSQFGENYELISFVLPGRDRKACKNKFKAEDRKNPNRITYCLNNRIPYDMQTLSRMTGKDFSGPTPEILAPAVLSLSEPDKPEDHQPLESTRKKSTTPGMARDGVEVLGDVSSFDKDGDA